MRVITDKKPSSIRKNDDNTHITIGTQWKHQQTTG